MTAIGDAPGIKAAIGDAPIKNKPVLQGKVALVTGASRGIGAAVAKHYAAEGAHVILAARGRKGLEAADDAIRAAGGAATLVEIDLADGAAVDRLGAQIYDRFGRLDILVGNAAALGELSPVPHIEPKVWQKVMDTNLTANYRLIRAMDPLLRQAKSATALFVTSGVTRVAAPFWGAYAVSKAGLEMLVEIYRAEVEGTGIRVELVDPGVVRTAMRAAAFPGEDPKTLPEPEAIMERFMQPLMRAA